MTTHPFPKPGISLLRARNFRRLCTLPLILLAATLFSPLGKTQQLLKNIEPDRVVIGSSHPHSFATTGTFGFFWAKTSKGRTLWRTDGTIQGTIPLHTSTNPLLGVKTDHGLGWNNRYFFTGYDPKSGWELFKTDGSLKGTVLVKDLDPRSGPQSSFPEQYTLSGNALFFVAKTGAGATLFKSDGTAQGTQALFSTKGLILGLSAFGQGVGTKVLFRVVGKSATKEGIAVSDGTPKGTRVFANPNGYQTGREDGRFAVLRTLFVFSAKSSSLQTGKELFVSDGTSKGTKLLKDIWPGAQSSSPRGFEVAGSKVFFSADHPLYGRELWSSDGTAKGTILVHDIEPGKVQGFPLSSDPSMLTARGNQILFSASTTATGIEPWISDGSPKGTHIIKDMVPGTGSSVPQNFVVAANRVFLTLQPNQNLELFRTDGTGAGTKHLLDLGKAPVTFPPPLFAPFGNRLLFSNYTSKTGNEPWISDGTVPGTHLLLDLVPSEFQTSSSFPQSFLSIGDQAYFSINTSQNRGQVWVTDGSPKRTTPLLSRIFPSPLYEGVDRFLMLDIQQSKIRLQAFLKGSGQNIPLHDFHLVESIEPIGKEWFIYERSATRALKVWKTDGTKQGTRWLSWLPPFTNLELTPATPLGSRAVIVGPFHPRKGTQNLVIWVTDGTQTGTKVLASLPLPFTAFSIRIRGKAVIGNELYLSLSLNNLHSILLKTDGSSKGTKAIRLFLKSKVRELFPLNGRILFSALDPKIGKELWITDGTPKGTKVLKDINPGPAGSFPYGFTATGKQAVFWASTPNLGVELYVTDGTTAGTHLLKDIHSGKLGSPKGIFGIFPIGSRRLAFLADDGKGIRFWGTDGSKKGTVPLGRVLSTPPGTIYTSPRFFRGQLFFQWFDPQHGFEPWVWFPGASARSHGLSCGSHPKLQASDPVLGAALTLSGSLASKQPTGVLLLGSTSSSPLRMGKGCWLYLDPFRLIVPIPVLAQQSKWTTTFPVPNQPSFSGLLFHAQVLHPLKAGGFDLSNPVELAAGN